MNAALTKQNILATATKLHPGLGALKGEVNDAGKADTRRAVVQNVADALHVSTPAELQAVREALAGFWFGDNIKLGEAGLKSLGGTIDNRVQAPVAQATSGLEVRMGGGVPGPVLNAVVPMLDKGMLGDEQLTAGIAGIHNAWYAQAQKDGYLLGERNKADPVMKMARSFYVQVEADGGQLRLKLDPKEQEFVQAYGRKQDPTRTLTDAEALDVGSQKILSEIRNNNQDALTESMRLVSAHLAGDVARVGAGDYLEKVKGMPDLRAPEKKDALGAPSPEKALAIIEQRIADIDAFVGFLGTKGDTPVARNDVPRNLQPTYDLFDEEHNRWTKQQLSWGTTSNPDFLRTEELPAKRLALDAAPLRGAYETLAAGLKSGSVPASALNAILPLLENGKISPEKLAEGLGLIHNAWYAQAKTDGYLLGERNKADPVMKMARPFFVQVETRGSELSLKLDDKEKDFVRAYGRKQAPERTLTDDEALKTGSDKILSEIRNNNQGALDDGLKLVTGHLAGHVVRTATANYVNDVGAMKQVELPGQSASAGVAPEKAREAVETLLTSVDDFLKFLKGKGEQTVSREELPKGMRAAYDLFAEEHDRWLAQQISWGSQPNQDWVHTSALPANRIALDAAPIRGALLTLQGALG